MERIRGEAAAARAGRGSGIRIKINSLVDETVIDELYRASRAGVPIECVVRGICALRPGVPGLSETVRVRSILGRFLEHSRILHFQGADEFWIGSADMMHRNLDRRIETLVRVQAPELQAEFSRILDLAFSPRVRTWELQPDGTWRRRGTMDGKPLHDYQMELTAWTAKRVDTP